MWIEREGFEQVPFWVNPERQFWEFVGIEGEDEDRDDSDPSMVIPNIRPLLVRTTICLRMPINLRWLLMPVRTTQAVIVIPFDYL